LGVLAPERNGLAAMRGDTALQALACQDDVCTESGQQPLVESGELALNRKAVQAPLLVSRILNPFSP